MEDTDDYESEILFYSLRNEKRDRDRLRRKFGILVAVAVSCMIALLLFNRFRSQDVQPLPNPRPESSTTSANVDHQINQTSFPIDQLDLAFVDNQPTAGQQQCRQPSYDYLQLAIRWPASLCLFHHCIQKPDRWVMYSLRPTFYNGTIASSCCNVSDFDLERIAPLQPLFADRWPSLFTRNDWNNSMKHQFDRYGSCIGSGLTPTEQQLRSRFDVIATSVPIQLHYIDVLRRLARWLPDIRSRLQQAQLVPQSNPDNLIAFASIVPALSLNRTTVVQCSRYRSGSREYSLLDTILLCFDRYSLQLIDCPNVTEDCRDQVFYPHPDAKLVWSILFYLF